MKIIHWKHSLTECLRRARILMADVARPVLLPIKHPASSVNASRPLAYERLLRVVLTDEVSRTLFDEYAQHRASECGDEETGWVLLGLRDVNEATVLATLPAGANRDAGEAHVRFNAAAQAVAGRMLRQWDRRLTILGVVHTHPGSLRHPSAGDLRGDREWVLNLRGKEGVFGIGTADAESLLDATPVALHPNPHSQRLGRLRFDWFTLGPGDHHYQPIPVELTLGPDLARPLRPIWHDLETYAERLERIAAIFSRVQFDVAEGARGVALAVRIAAGGTGEAVRVVLEGKDVRYFYESGGAAFQVDLADTLPDHGVCLILAEVAARS